MSEKTITHDLIPNIHARSLLLENFETDTLDTNVWEVVSGSPSVSSSQLQFTAVGKVRTKQKFRYGVLIFTLKSSAVIGKIGFESEDGNNYVRYSGGSIRSKNQIDTSENAVSISITETQWNLLVILWKPDEIVVWLNGSIVAVYQGHRIPHKPLSVIIEQTASGSVNVDLIAVYPEPILNELLVGTGATAYTTNICVPVGAVLVGGHGNAWNNATPAAGGTSSSVLVLSASVISVFGNANGATTLTVQFSYDGTNFYDSEYTITLTDAGDFGKTIQCGARYVRLKTSASVTITATISGKT